MNSITFRDPFSAFCTRSVYAGGLFVHPLHTNGPSLLNHEQLSYKYFEREEKPPQKQGGEKEMSTHTPSVITCLTGTCIASHLFCSSLCLSPFSFLFTAAIV